MEEHILSPRVVLQELGHIINLSADGDPAVLPGGVEGDLGRVEELLGLPRHGRPPTGALVVPFLLLRPLSLRWDGGRRQISSR